MVKRTLILAVLCCTMCCTVYSARILGIFPTAAPSHYILGNALMKGLAEAGHNVTMISPFEEKNPPERGSYRDVVLTGFLEEYHKLMQGMNLFDNKKQSAVEFMFTFFNIMLKLNDDFFNNENVQKLLKSDEKFDVIIVEQFINDVMKILGLIYNVPVIAFSSVGHIPWVNNIVGNPNPLSYIPQMNTNFSSKMSFWERLGNVISYTLSILLDRLYFFPQQNKILQKHFDNPPDIYDLYHNVSFVLLNSHESLNQPVPSVPNMAQIGGYHVRPPKKLPKDLKEYLDNATEGVVYFSLGSNLRSKNLPPHKRDAFLTALGKLKEKVLWKWEDDDLPGRPSNVKTEKWLPQQDILAHPNVKLFITHCGLLSTIEAVYHGVPLLGIPVFADQHTNAKLVTRAGFAQALPYEDPSFSEEKLSELLQELLTNTQYRDNVKKRSELFHDRPMKPMDTAVYWVEHVIRNKGAPHLRVAGVDLPWYKYYCLDVIGFLVTITSLFLYVLYIIVKKLLIFRSICYKSKRKSKGKSKKE